MEHRDYWQIGGNSRMVLHEDPPAATPGEAAPVAGDAATATAVAPAGEPAADGGDPIPGPLRSFVTDTVKRGITAGMRDLTAGITTMVRETVQGALAPAPVAPVVVAGDQPNGAAAVVNPLETSTETRLARLESETRSAQQRETELTSLLATERTARDVDTRDGHIKQLANEAGAVDAEEVLAIVGPMMRKDDQRGWLFEVDGEFGKEFRTPEEFIPQFMEQRAHLRRAATARGGSGAGGGTGAGPGGGSQPGYVAGVPLTRERLADHKFYSDNREEIHRVLQARAARERVATLEEYGLRDPHMLPR